MGEGAFKKKKRERMLMTKVFVNRKVTILSTFL